MPFRFAPLLLAGLLSAACAERAEQAPTPAETIRTTLSIEGMTCEGCVKGVTARLSSLPGVVAVHVSLDDKQGRIDHDPARTSPDALMAAIAAGGWKASLPADREWEESPPPVPDAPQEDSQEASAETGESR